MKEATARIKINKLLEAAGWRFFSDSNGFANIRLEPNRDDWRRAEIVVTTAQSLLFNNKYQRLFSPTDFDLVISDEAHQRCRAWHHRKWALSGFRN